MLSSRFPSTWGNLVFTWARLILTNTSLTFTLFCQVAKAIRAFLRVARKGQLVCWTKWYRGLSSHSKHSSRSMVSSRSVERSVECCKSMANMLERLLFDRTTKTTLYQSTLRSVLQQPNLPSQQSTSVPEAVLRDLRICMRFRVSK